MRSLFLLLLTFCSIQSVRCGEDVPFVVKGKLIVPHINAGNIDITLNGNQHRTMSRADGHFSFYDVSSGVYLLDVQSPLYVFSQLKLKVSRENATVNLVEYKFPGAKRVPASYPIVLKAHSRVQYSQPKEGMSIGTFLRNPMAYMVLFLVGIITLMPMLLKNIDPEELKQMQGGAAGEDPMKKLQAAFGMGPKDDDDD